MNSTLTNSTLLGFSEIFVVLPALMTSTLVINLCVGLPLNSYVIFLLISKGRSMNVSVEFTISHIVAEIFFSLNSIFYVLFMALNSPWVAYLLKFNFRTSMSARPFFQCCVCLEQYLAVIHPVVYLRFKQLRYRVACSLLVWTCALVLGIGTHALPISPYKLFSSLYLIILAIESFCCLSILKGLMHAGPGDREKERGEMNAAKKKAFQIVSINLLTLLIQNLPITVSFSLENVVNDFNLATVISGAINSFAGLLQPIFILHKTGKLSFLKCA